MLTGVEKEVTRLSRNVVELLLSSCLLDDIEGLTPCPVQCILFIVTVTVERPTSMPDQGKDSS